MTPDKIYLVGFMACGKSTLARALARRLGWGVEDIDDLIEARERRTIADIFAAHGEPYFRALEREMLRLVQPMRHVEGMLMAYLPAERIAFQADLYDTHEPPKAAQLPAMRALATQVELMKLDITTLAHVHGPPVPWRTFEEALRSLGDGS